jgi:hypothetical protein
MAVTRKPQRARQQSPALDIDALINKGGSPAADSAAAAGADRTVGVVLRLPAAMLERVDASVHGRPVKIPRHTWILEAIHEKLVREEGGGS